MKKRFIAATIFIVGVILLGILYWSGYLVFNGPIPSFTLNPGTTQSDENTNEPEGAPQLVIENIKGRLNKISVDIRNIGDMDATTVIWTVSVKGGLLKRIDLRSTGTMDSLPRQSRITIITDRIPLGFGRLEITVTVEASEGSVVTQTARGFKFLFFVVGVRM
ncbi:hypothetical protein AYK25_07160 [Thermoplasmatales archaeon SM1-50]|nr:MAG: hypothetical protein AYK25_07160 [Thermoplasmatales archaeon SM1-50]